MADAVRLNECFEGMASFRLICLTGDVFGESYLQALRRLGFEGVIATSVPADALEMLATPQPSLVIMPAITRLPALDARVHDQCRATQATYLAITLTHQYLDVGPLFSQGRSCLYCWQARCEQHEAAEVGSAADSEPCLQTAYLPSAAYLAAALTSHICRQRCEPYTSLLWRYKLATNRAEWVTVTSSPACGRCRREFRSAHSPTQELEALVSALFVDSHDLGLPCSSQRGA